MEIKEVQAKRILNPTSIDLGDYVINPYKGCMYACLYCYVRFNKVTMKETRPWGEYVDVRKNAPELLEKELARKKPERVLLGSTTECFGPQEKQYGVTGRILEILNRHKVYYSILTRSPHITEYLGQLNEGYCENIYFTVNNFSAALKNKLEPKSPDFNLRYKAVQTLIENGLPVIPYCSPVLPYISNIGHIFSLFPDAQSVEFEGLNFNLGNISKVIEMVSDISPDTALLYKRMRNNEKIYNDVWAAVKKEMIKEAIKYKKNHHIYIHRLNAYFENSYR